MLKVALWIVFSVLFIVFGGFAGLRLIDKGLRRTGRSEHPVPSDVAIVLGAYTNGYRPSPVLKSRLRAAIDLYRHGYVQYFIVSGGRGADESVTESSSMKRFLILNGVPATIVLEEMFSVDTWENLRNSQVVMERHQLKSAVIVTSDYHLPRALAVANQLGMKATGYASWSTRLEWRAALREVLASVKYTVSGQANWRL